MVLKKYVSKIINSRPIYSSTEIINKIKKYEYVSFDIFDTLVKRDFFEPGGVFEYIGKKNQLFNFQSIRVKAEQNARKKSAFNEVTLEEIYEEVPLERSVKTKLMNDEIYTEKQCCVANPLIKEIYNWCLINKKIIIITTDIYLDKDTIKEILKKCGYRGFKYLFISSVERERKIDGKLFLIVLNKLKIKNNEIVHIGDSFKPDFVSPRLLGIKSIRIARNINYNLFIHNNRSNQALNHFLNVNRNLGWNIYFQFGYEIVGPLIYGLCKWIHEDALKNNIRKLFFLARDGYLIQKVYRQIYSNDAILNEYLYISRKALRLPQIWLNPELDCIANLFPSYAYLNCKDFCDGLGIDYEAAIIEWRNNGLKDDETFLPKNLTDDKVITFYERIKSTVIDKSFEEYGKVVEYLNQHDFEGNVGIVDIGWAGTIQKCLVSISKAANMSVNINGYYFGMSTHKNVILQAKSFLPLREQIQEFAAALVEYPFLAPEGSVVGYNIEKNGKIDVIKKSFEYDGVDNEKSIIEYIQKGVIEFANVKKNKRINMEFDAQSALDNYKKFLRKPTPKCLELFGELHFYDGTIRKIASPSQLFKYVLNLKQFKYDLSNSGWKTGFLKRCVGIPLPYYRLLKFIKTYQDKEM